MALAVGLRAATAGAQPAAPIGDRPTTIAPGTPPTTPTAADAHIDVKRPTLVWDPSWPKFRIAEYFATGAFAAASFLALAIPDDEGRWRATNGFDNEVRSAIRLGDRADRFAAGDASDLTLALGINHVMFDSVVVAWWGHGRGSVALQLTLINFETIAFNTAVTSLIKSITARQRPYFRECSTDPEFAQLDECDGTDRYRSFISGHTSTAFAVAGLTCMHHAHLPLYGGGAPDALACVLQLATASATGVLRIASDNHYALDVLSGAAVGLASGLGLPWVLHYRGGARPAQSGEEEKRPAVTLSVVPGPFSGAVVGEF